MASQAYVFYCFESLAASFEDRDPPALNRVVELYDRYKGTPEPSSASDQPLDNGAAANIEDEDEHDEDDDDEDDEEVAEHEEDHDDRPFARRDRPQIPSISRLQASTPSSRSSASSSPSVLSANSSNSQLTTASSTSTVSSRPSYASTLHVHASYPLFVTWNTLSRSGHKSLRGCIGTFDATPLESGLATYALTSAFEDHRFSPIPQTLMPALSCALTLLANFESCKDAMDWTPGTHGLRISFTHHGRRHGATYLPDVAVDQGWTKEETVESLMKKAGWDGGSGYGVARRILKGSRSQDGSRSKPWDEMGDFRAVRYQGLRASATYSEWQEWRAWVSERNEVLR